MPGKPVFLDTNMWVYLFTDPRSAEDRRKQNIVQEVLSNDHVEGSHHPGK
uniref:PIN domain-containing protein n=1 Tax=Candidatus Kentrum sp. SD TaxID=2126332 RepID=A0A451BKG5_9GAMM|nr:MAG: hypothetical protein BECKSD772D_GA0070982_10231 [Candidatus Kentron sp. SD]